MKYIKQILIILAFTGVGEALAYLIPFPIPAAIYGIVLLLIALGTGILKTSQVKEVSGFLISIMPILYVPICVRILEYWGVISQNAAAIVSITLVSTFLVFAVSGLVTQGIMKKKEGKSHD
ncbi:MAG: CidA/LrgA family protein [Oscillospiraceae bacterium]|nr:CidA/LrgA family protein [Oscillospiraceae bacterium]